MFTAKHYLNITSLFILTVAGGLILFRFSFLYSENPVISVTVYFFLLTAGVLAADFFLRKVNLPDVYKQAVILSYMILIITLCGIYVMYSGSGEPHLYLLNYYLIIGILYSALIFTASELLNNNKADILFFASALLFGAVHLLANALIIPSIIFVLYFFRNNLIMLFVFAVLAVLTYFTLDFILVEDGGSFTSLAGAPLTTLPPVWKILILISAAYTGWSVSDVKEVYITGAFFLFMISMVSIVLLLQSTDFYQAVLIGEPFVVILIPLCLFAFDDYKVDKFLGKIIPVS